MAEVTAEVVAEEDGEGAGAAVSGALEGEEGTVAIPKTINPIMPTAQAAAMKKALSLPNFEVGVDGGVSFCAVVAKVAAGAVIVDAAVDGSPHAETAGERSRHRDAGCAPRNADRLSPAHFPVRTGYLRKGGKKSLIPWA